MTLAMLGPGSLDLVQRLAARRIGVTRREVVERFRISYSSAWRTFRRLVRDGRIGPTDVRRRDWMGSAKKPSIVFNSRWRPREDLYCTATTLACDRLAAPRPVWTRRRMRQGRAD
jgi:hypothetical protein